MGHSQQARVEHIFENTVSRFSIGRAGKEGGNRNGSGGIIGKFCFTYRPSFFTAWRQGDCHSPGGNPCVIYQEEGSSESCFPEGKRSERERSREGKGGKLVLELHPHATVPYCFCFYCRLQVLCLQGKRLTD